jgi:ribose-phosphate pyrophosphokinase
MNKLRIIGGSSHTAFTEKVCEHLGIEPTRSQSILFSNGNRFVKIDEAVRGDDVFVIQTQRPSVDEHLMEMLIYIRALKTASAKRITAVFPYFPYSRSDKTDQPRVAITARLLADLLEVAGAKRALIMEMHAPQIQGFFSIPCDHLVAAPAIVSYLRQHWDLSNHSLVAGDSGAAKMIKQYADGLQLPVAIMDKRREGNEEKVSIKGVIGDVRGKKTLLIDDETSTGGTLVSDSHYLLEHAGALSVDACFVHAALGPQAASRLNASPIGRFLTTDTIPLDDHDLRDTTVISVAKRFADCIRRTHQGESIRSLNEFS